jgi:uncharacterized membrane protein YbhN (UPF0104 family)
MNKNYKSIFFFVKIVIALSALYFIYHKVFKSDQLPLILSSINTAFNHNITFLIIALVLMPINWLLEAAKWKLICEPLEKLSLSKSSAGVFAGVTVSIFTPNRVGEFAGKVLTLKDGNRLNGIAFSFLTGFAQMTITVFFAAISLCILISNNSALNQNLVFVSTAVLFLTAGLFFVIFFVKLSPPQIIGSRLTTIVISFTNSREKIKPLLFLSLIRYIVFSIQFYVLLLAFNVELSFSELILIIPLTFFISTLVPSFLLTEIITRTAVAGFLCSTIIPNQNSEAASVAYLFLWIINIATAALIGMISIHFINYKKSEP